MCEKCDPLGRGKVEFLVQDWNSNMFRQYPKRLDKIECFVCRNNAICCYQTHMQNVIKKPIKTKKIPLSTEKRQEIQHGRLLHKVEQRKRYEEKAL